MRRTWKPRSPRRRPVRSTSSCATSRRPARILVELKRLRTAAGRVPIIVLAAPGEDRRAADAVRELAQDWVAWTDLDERLLRHVLRYVQARQTAEEALWANDQCLRAVVGSLEDLVFTLDGEHRCTSVLGRWVRDAGLDAAEFVGRTPAQILGSEAAREHDRALARALAGERVVYEWSLPVGEVTRRFQTSVAPQLDASGRIEGVFGLARDITDQRQLQATLMLSDRMLSVGTLAGGVAHEINNPLATILANVEYTERELAEVREHSDENGKVSVAVLAELDDPLHDARDAANRIREIVRDLKSFSPSAEDWRGPVDVNRSMEASLRLAWPEIRHRARLVKDYGVLAPVSANEGHLRQVMLNLVVNAAQSISEGNAERNEIRIVSRMAGPEVVIEIRDTGSGIPPEILPKIFDPFFTTKPVGMGTGLGLPICHRIVAGLGGSLTVATVVGRGSTFTVTLPALAPPPSEQPAPAASMITARRSRILVVDDEPAVGRALARTLSSRHDVVTVTGAREALELIGRPPQFDVIMCDLLMPEMTGMDLYDELVRRAPEHAARVVFMSGGSFTPRARDFLERVTNPRLEKPFDTQSLLALLARLLP